MRKEAETVPCPPASAGHQQKPGQGPGADSPSGPRRGEMRLLLPSASRREGVRLACFQPPSRGVWFQQTCDLMRDLGLTSDTLPSRP